MQQRATILAKEATAAAMLDLNKREFRNLVDLGALPPPIRIGSLERWDTTALEAVARGVAARPDEEIEF